MRSALRVESRWQDGTGGGKITELQKQQQQQSGQLDHKLAEKQGNNGQNEMNGHQLLRPRASHAGQHVQDQQQEELEHQEQVQENLSKRSTLSAPRQLVSSTSAPAQQAETRREPPKSAARPRTSLGSKNQEVLETGKLDIKFSTPAPLPAPAMAASTPVHVLKNEREKNPSDRASLQYNAKSYESMMLKEQRTREFLSQQNMPFLKTPREQVSEYEGVEDSSYTALPQRSRIFPGTVTPDYALVDGSASAVSRQNYTYFLENMLSREQFDDDSSAGSIRITQPKPGGRISTRGEETESGTEYDADYSVYSWSSEHKYEESGFEDFNGETEA